ncbi:hypothetical protein ACSVDE_02370 [Pseudalkalibacillus sp. Hm43]|uniref:hypothetical protein n=1 Tax=Pseudalkalibacillus sp. Hm43 TaxID=3450742 RepID=UPI003F4325BC
MLNKHLKQLRPHLKETKFKDFTFDEQHQEKVFHGIRENKGVHSKRSYWNFGLSIAVSLSLLFGIVYFGASQMDFFNGYNVAHEGKEVNWEARQDYKEDGKLLLSVYPDPALTAGKPYGYLFHFTEPFKTYEGKELTINAYHKETGEKLMVVPPTTITNPSSGYPSLERYTPTFEVPEGGLWRYEVLLNGEFYADVIIRVSYGDTKKEE